MKDQVESKLKPVKKTEKEVIEDSDDSDDDTDVQDFVDWRNKCWYTQLNFILQVIKYIKYVLQDSTPNSSRI